MNISSKNLHLFCSKLSILLECKVFILDALDILNRQNVNKQLRYMVKNMHADISNGCDIYTSLKRQNIENDFFITCMYIASKGDNLKDVVKNLSNYYERIELLVIKLKANLIYPAILSVVTSIVLSLLILVILPMFQNIFSNNDIQMPQITMMLIDISNYIMRNIISLVIIIILFLIGLFFCFKNKKVNYALSFFITNCYISKNTIKKLLSWRISQDMNMLLSSNIDVLDSFEIVCTSQRISYIKYNLYESLVKLKKGSNLSVVLNETNLFEQFFLDMVEIGEKSEDVKSCFEKLSEVYNQDVQNIGDSMLKYIEPTIIIFMGIIVGFIVISVSMPMFEMINSIEM